MKLLAPNRVRDSSGNPTAEERGEELQRIARPTPKKALFANSNSRSIFAHGKSLN
jgi:hypothetical protein